MMKTLDKELIKQIILDYEKFKRRDVWMCNLETIVDSFVELYSEDYLTDLGG